LSASSGLSGSASLQGFHLGDADVGTEGKRTGLFLHGGIALARGRAVRIGEPGVAFEPCVLSPAEGASANREFVREAVEAAGVQNKAR